MFFFSRTVHSKVAVKFVFYTHVLFHECVMAAMAVDPLFWIFFVSLAALGFVGSFKYKCPREYVGPCESRLGSLSVFMV